ncbi:MAG: sulfotransferase family 2 domain-containing protein [Mangrovicoccus sp.]
MSDYESETAEDIEAEAKLADMPRIRELLYRQQDIDGALALAQKCFQERPRRRIHEEIGNLYRQKGDDFLARSIYQACLLCYGQLHSTNLIHANIAVARAFVDDGRKLLYIPIPKNGSTTIKNFFSKALLGQTFGEGVHLQMSERYRFVTPVDLQEQYKDYFKFAVIRDPLDRVQSYYSRNVRLGALARHARDVENFLGLSTAPSEAVFVTKLADYRRRFIDAKHHTDPQHRYLDHFSVEECGLKLFNMAGIATIRAHLAEAYGQEIEDERFMQTGTSEKKPLPEFYQSLRGLYKRDYNLYGKLAGSESRGKDGAELKTKRRVRQVHFYQRHYLSAKERAQAEAEAQTGAAIAAQKQN